MSGFNITPNANLLRGAINSQYTAPGQPGGSVAGLQGARAPVAGVAPSGGPFSGGGLGVSSAPTGASYTNPGYTASTQQADMERATVQNNYAGQAQNLAAGADSRGGAANGLEYQQGGGGQMTGNAGSAPAMMPSNPAFYGR